MSNETREVTYACGHTFEVCSRPFAQVSQEQYEEVLAKRLTEPCTDCLQHLQAMWWATGREEEWVRHREEQMASQRAHDELFLAAVREVAAEIRLLREELLLRRS